MLPGAILFDLDDTILSDDIVSEQAWRDTCEICASRVKSTTAEELFEVINSARITFWNDPVNLRGGAWRNLFQSRMTVVRTALQELDEADDGLAMEIVSTYNDLKAKMVRLFPNADRTLRELRTRGIKLALLTNGEAQSQRAKVERLGLETYFPVCLIEGELGYGKPDSRIFREALDRLQVTPDHTWMVGDRLEFDILGAQQMGILGIWCDYRRKGLPPGENIIPDRIITDISDLLTLVEEKERC